VNKAQEVIDKEGQTWEYFVTSVGIRVVSFTTFYAGRDEGPVGKAPEKVRVACGCQQGFISSFFFFSQGFIVDRANWVAM
jgi:hypothetical protein